MKIEFGKDVEPAAIEMAISSSTQVECNETDGRTDMHTSILEEDLVMLHTTNTSTTSPYLMHYILK